MNPTRSLLEEILLDDQFAADDWSIEILEGILQPKKMFGLLREIEEMTNVKL